MEALFLKCLNMGIAAGWVVLAVLLLRLLFRNASKRIRCALWALVGIRLVCPLSFESVLSLIPSAETVPREILLSREPAIESGIEALDRAVNPVIAGSLVPDVGASVNPMQIVVFLASGLWAAGVAAMLLYAVISCLKLRHSVRASIKTEGNLWICDDLKSPFIFGILSPRIYLPSDLGGEQLACVIAHEKAHLARRDHWWKPLGFALLSVYWYQPLCWIAYILLNRDIELACDERVVREMGDAQKRQYAEALLKCSASRRMVSACPLAFGEVGVKERIKGVLYGKKPGLWMTAAAVAGCMAAAVCFLTDPVTAGSGEGIYGARYSVAEILYDFPMMDFAYTAETAPEYVFTADACLMQQGRSGLMGDNAAWNMVGVFHEADDRKDEILAFLREAPMLPGDAAVQGLLDETERIWYVDTADEGGWFYLVMQTGRQEVLLATCYGTPGEAHVRWIWRLERQDGQGDTAYLAALLNSMNPGANAWIFAFYESEEMPDKLLAGFLDERQHMGCAVFDKGKNGSDWRIRGFDSGAGRDRGYLTLGEDWGFDHSVTVVLSNRRDIAYLTAQAGERFQRIGASAVSAPSMYVFEWNALLSDEEEAGIEIRYFNELDEEILP